MTNLSFEALDEADFDWAYAVYETTTRPHIERSVDWAEQRQRDERLEGLRSGTFEAIVDESGHRVGLQQVTEDETELTIRHLELIPAVQGRGLGSAAIRCVTSRAAASNKAVTLRVLHANPRARELYTRLGFVVVEERTKSAEMRLMP